MYSIKNTPPCRVWRSSEPAFAGEVSPWKLRLGSGLSRHLHKIETEVKRCWLRTGKATAHA